VLGSCYYFRFISYNVWVNIRKEIRIYIFFDIVLKTLMIGKGRNGVLAIITAAVILGLWIVADAVLDFAIRRRGELFPFSKLVRILKDIAQAANIFNWLSYPQLWIIGLPIVKEGWPRTEVQLPFTNQRL
jgi:hypothetical protein